MTNDPLLMACEELSGLLESERGDTVSPEDLRGAFLRMAALTEEQRVARAIEERGVYNDGSPKVNPMSWMWLVRDDTRYSAYVLPPEESA
jgi:hypothetical protein